MTGSMKCVAMLTLYRETDDCPILVAECEAHCHFTLPSSGLPQEFKRKVHKGIFIPVTGDINK